MLTRAATARTCASATVRTAGPDSPPVPPPSHGAPDPSGCGANARSVLISETASAPEASAACATSATSAVFGVSFTISGLAVSGRTSSSNRASSAGSAPMSRPVRTLGHDTFSSIAATSGRSCDRFDELGDLGGGGAHDVRDQRDRQPGERRQVRVEVAAQALVRQADRVDQPAGGLIEPRRRVAVARLERDRLRDEGRERELGLDRRDRRRGGRRSRRTCPIR